MSGGLYGVAKQHGYSSPAADKVAEVINSQGFNDAMVGMAIPGSALRRLLTVEKLTYDQAAEVLGVSRSAVAGKASRMGISSGRKAGEQTEEGIERLRAARAEQTELGKTGGEASGKARSEQVALTTEQKALRERLQKAADAFKGARRDTFSSTEKPKITLPKLKFMEGPGPESE